MNNMIILLVGKSGSGKTAVTNELSKLGYRSVESYTSRPPRFPGEKGHIFCTEEELLAQRNIVGYTYFDGHHYCATQEQVDNADIFVVDPNGAKFFRRFYKGTKTPHVIYLDVPLIKRVWRMMRRGDNPSNILRRLCHDEAAFSDLGCVAMALPNKDDINKTIECIDAYCRYCDREWVQSQV